MGLFRPVGLRVGPRSVICVLLGWFPLVVLVLGSDLHGPPTFASFIADFGVHTRSLVAAPFFVLCELICLKRLNEIARYFLTSGLLQDQDRDKFNSLVHSTKTLMNSTIAEIVAIFISFLTAVALFRLLAVNTLPPWYLADAATHRLSVAGVWYVFVSVPLLIILFLGWLWRVFLWGRFLFHLARFKLRLVAAHPDHAAGLKFLNAAIFAFIPLAFTMGLIVAGSAANRVAYRGASWDELQTSIAGLLLLVLVLFPGPLLVFTFKLHRQKIVGIFRYGLLAHSVGVQFEKKWLAQNQRVTENALEVEDFSATTDLYQVVSNVYDISILPFEIRTLVALCVVTLLPFVPVVLMFFPLKVILNEIAILLF
ncbi:MAG TPA: hypothetical protein VI306_01860 [Pyrinomonadaceae bacterium]